MGGKTSKSTQSVSIPPEVMARYNSVNSRAEAVATQPFQQYSTNPNAFVAPLNQQQYAGIGGINAAANLAQPYYGTAGQMTMAGAGAVNPEQYSAAGVQRYMNPYISNVANTTAAQMGNLFGQQAEELKGGAIRAGAFGGDRAGIAQGNLANQQSLAFGKQMADIYGGGFSQAQQMFGQQQGVNLAAEQANQQRLLAAGQQLGGLGGAAQTAALQGAQAQLGAGTLGQQTEQAGLTALYNQFLQQQAYPFQVAQFLGNIAMGTGALSGSTTTTTQPAPFFSDERMKDNIEPIGETYDGQKIVKFNYKNSPQKQIGLVAQDVERHYPEAVGLAGGYKTVDYDGATKKAARMGKYEGGLVNSMGGKVIELHRGEGYATGGLPAGINTAGLERTIAAQQAAPVGSGGIDVQRAEEARALAPTPFIPPSVTNPVFNPQPIPGTGSSKNAPQYTNWNDYLTALASGKEMNDPSLRSPASSTNEKDGKRSLADLFSQFKDFYSGQTLGGFGSRGEGYAYGGEVDPILAQQAQMYAALEASHVPTTRQLYGGISKHSRVPEASLPVGQLKQAGELPQQQESGLSQGLGAYKQGMEIAKLAREAKEGLGGLMSKNDNVNVDASGLTSAGSYDPTQAGLAAEAAEDPSTFERLMSLFANQGGRMQFAQGGDAEDDDVIPYGEENSPSRRLDIPDVDPTRKLPSAPPLPQQQGGPGDLLLKVIPFFLASGGRAGYATEGGVAPRSERNNNPGNIIDSPFARSQPGYKGSESGFAVFESPEAGLGAMETLLQSYGKRGFNTPESITGRWAPATAKGNTPESTSNYGKFIASKVGVEPSAALDLSDPVKRRAVAMAMAEFEGGKPFKGMKAAAPAEDERANLPSEKAKDAGQPDSGITIPEKKKAGLMETLGQEKYVVPALAGLGAMLSSRSPFLGVAIGEGLVGGAGAYQQQKKLEAEVGRTTAETQRIYSDIAGNSIIVKPDGTRVYQFVKPDGTFGQITYAEWLAIPPDQRPPIDPRAIPLLKGNTGGLGAGTPGGESPAGAGLGAAETKAPPPTTGGPEITAQVPPTVKKPEEIVEKPLPEETVGLGKGELKPLPITLDEKDMADAVALGQKASGLGPTFSQQNPDVFEPQIKVATDAQDAKVQLDKFASALTSLPAGGSISTTGPLAPYLRGVVGTINQVLKGAGFNSIVNEADLKNADKAEKIAAQLRAAGAAAGGQESYSALADFAKNFPSISTSPAGAVELMADIIMRNQTEIDKNNYFQQWKTAAAGERGQFAEIANRTGAGLEQRFRDKFNSKLEEDRQNLIQMMKTGPVGVDDPETGRPMSWYNYISKYGPQLSNEEKAMIENKFGQGILRVFPSVNR